MKTIPFLSFFLIFTSLNSFSQSAGNQTQKETKPIRVYANYGIELSVEGSYIIIKNNRKESENWFFQAYEIVRFQEDRYHGMDGQHIMSSPDIHTKKEKAEIPKSISSISNNFNYGTYLSSLFILPKISEEKFKTELLAYSKKYPEYEMSNKIETIKIGDKNAFQWRFQLGKTRLDHYLVFGEKYHYLFVSSPYSSADGVIESTIQKIKFVK